MPHDSTEKTPRVGYSTVVGGSGGSRGGWTFDDLKYAIPTRVHRHPPAFRNTPLVDGDLYLENMALPDLHQGVADALKQAANCLRHDLFTPALAMLGAALEGELTLLGEVIGSAFVDSPKAKKIAKSIADSSPTIRGLSRQILLFLEDRAESKNLAREAGYSLMDVRTTFHWVDTIRDSRNVLHWNNSPTIAHSFEGVGAFMLGVGTHFGLMEAIRLKAPEFGASPTIAS